jgi:hypothetical protein
MSHEQRALLIEQYGTGPEALRRAWNACPEGARHWKPSPKEWSAHEIVIHCADSETFAATRIRLLAAEDQPMIVGYDQDRWVRVFDYANRSTELAFAVIAASRASTLDLLRQFDDRQWRASGQHSESGAYTAGDWLAIYGVHLHDHARQIESNVAHWQIDGHGNAGPSSRERTV